MSIVLSSGRTTTTVPDVVGKSQDEAQATIEAAGLTYNATVNDAKTTDPSKNDQYIVTAIDPQAGQSVNLQSSVTLTVTHYVYEAAASPSPTPAPTGATIQPPDGDDKDKEKGKDKNNNHG